MEIVLLILCIIIFLIFLVWIIGFFYLNDVFITTINIKKFKRILVIFPHADDEALTASGLMRKASLQGKEITWVVLTKGERGNQSTTFDETLKPIRTNEGRQVAKLLKVKNLIQDDFGDGEIHSKKTEAKKFLTKIFQEYKPELVITYDLSGWYGHPDHIATTEVINDLIKSQFTTTHLWYVTLPKKVWAMAGLPTEMAKNADWINHRTYPNVKVFVGFNVIQTVQSLYLYKSQYLSWRKSIPFAPIPMWFFISMNWFNYFYQVQ